MNAIALPYQHGYFKTRVVDVDFALYIFEVVKKVPFSLKRQKVLSPFKKVIRSLITRYALRNLSKFNDELIMLLNSAMRYEDVKRHDQIFRKMCTSVYELYNKLESVTFLNNNNLKDSITDLYFNCSKLEHKLNTIIGDHEPNSNSENDQYLMDFASKISLSSISNN